MLLLSSIACESGAEVGAPVERADAGRGGSKTQALPGVAGSAGIGGDVSAAGGSSAKGGSGFAGASTSVGGSTSTKAGPLRLRDESFSRSSGSPASGKWVLRESQVSGAGRVCNQKYCFEGGIR